MGIGTRIDSRGVRQVNNAQGCKITVPLTIENGIALTAGETVTGVAPYGLADASTAASAETDAISVTSPGFYWVSGSTTTTASLPAAGAYPGANIMFGQINTSGSFMLTGTVRTTGADGAFSSNGVGIASIQGARVGDQMTVERSVNLWSDGIYWIPQASSGSVTIA